MASACASCHKTPPEVSLKWPSPPKGLERGIANPFSHLEAGTWLHNRFEKDVYGLLIDAYRLRMEDNHNMEGDADEDSIYGGPACCRRGETPRRRPTARCSA
ncbi:hypothetical protein CDD83_3463 [Cordyceps sp. RAO-2017]|nr:hypothetical protein CDD83_3463 [Cordyceps sp. RAO-2017]